jgi:hypothetical protein
MAKAHRELTSSESVEMAYNGKNVHGEWGLALGAQIQSTMMDIIGMRSIPMFKVVRSFFWSSCPCY